MKRFLWMLSWTLKVGLFLGLIAWLVMQPGRVRITWQDYTITTEIGVAAVILLISFLFFAWVFYYWRRLVALPGSFRQQRQWQRLQSGYQAIQSGLLALYSRDFAQANKQSRQAVQLLPDHALSHYLAAETARQQQDLPAAETHLHNLQKTEHGEGLALYGLLNLALEQRNTSQALHYARQLHQTVGLTPFIVDTLSSLETEQGHLIQAEKILRQALQTRWIQTAEDTARWRGALSNVLLRLSEQAVQRQDYPAALECAREALKWQPTSVDAAQQTALLWQQRTYKRRAQKTILKAYEINPQPELVQVWLQLHGAQNAMNQLAVVERLTRENPDSPVSALAMAEANRRAGLWGVARRHAMQAVEKAPSRPAYQLLAAIEEADSGDTAKIRHWQDLANKS